VPDFAPLVQRAQQALAKEPKNARCRSVLGALLHRAGRHQEAIQELEAALPQAANADRAWHWLFLAMAHQRLGHTDEAKQWLTRADARLAELPQQWEWLELHLLRREADALLKKAG